MIVRRNTWALPRVWSGNIPHAGKALRIANITLLPGARLKMKLLVFKNQADLRKFHVALDRLRSGKCNYPAGEILNKGTVGFVTALAHADYGETILNVDPVYFACMCLSAEDLDFEVVCHESVHAAFAYMNRAQGRSPWAKVYGKETMPEEPLCYPAGRIAHYVNKFLNDEGLYKLSKSEQL